ncbi:MAG TPA: hypothetical protein VG756_02815 [Pseudonocardiaceae bacterium]|jgi:hypothetical protein|nr:hypothetical protein [Pseudonocardiaceae bacterium]
MRASRRQQRELVACAAELSADHVFTELAALFPSPAPAPPPAPPRPAERIRTRIAGMARTAWRGLRLRQTFRRADRPMWRPQASGPAVW